MKKIILFTMLILCINIYAAELPQDNENYYIQPEFTNAAVTESSDDSNDNVNSNTADDGESGGNAADDEITDNNEPTDDDSFFEYADIITDEHTGFDLIYERSSGVIYDIVPNPDVFHGDSSILQRTDKFSQHISYSIPYWKKAEITAYFYASEEITDFIFKSGDTEIIPKKTVESADGHWHKVTYTLLNPVETSDILSIHWPDISETELTSWGQALGKAVIYTAFPKACTIEYLSEYEYAVPDAGSVTYHLSAAVLDQSGIAYEEDLIWEYVTPSDGITFDPSASAISVNCDTADKSSITIAISTVTLPATEVVITFKTYKPGDINGDFQIDETDLEIAAENYYKSDSSRGDINKNGITDIYDLVFIRHSFTETE